jgi:hypothetical protein
MPHFDGRSERVEPIALGNPQVDVNRFQIHPLTHEALHDLWRFDQGTIVTMGPDFSASFTHNVCSTLGMIPMAVRQPELNQAAFLARQYRLNINPDIARGIDQHGLAAIRDGQQVGIGLNRPRRQDV